MGLAYAGAAMLGFRVAGSVGYLYGKRAAGAAFHLAEIYVLYVASRVAYGMVA